MVEHDSCNTSLHRGEALITLTASSSGCNTGSFRFEFDVNGTQVEKTGLTGGPSDPSAFIGTSSCTDGPTLDYVSIDSYSGSTFCTRMTLVHWEQTQDWPAIQAGTC